jgi:hypothetical protein
VLAVLGCLIALRQRRWLYLYPALWMAGAFVSLLFHAPVWYHHQLLITLPAAMLAGIAAGEALARLPDLKVKGRLSAGDRRLYIAVLILSLTAIATRLPFILGEFKFQPVFSRSLDLEWEQQHVVDVLVKNAGDTHWMMTDVPMYAFRARLPVPPELAVITSKRMATGNLTEAQIIAAVQKYNPEQVYLGRFKFPNLKKYLSVYYQPGYSKGRYKLYLRDDVAER